MLMIQSIHSFEKLSSFYIARDNVDIMLLQVDLGLTLIKGILYMFDALYSFVLLEKEGLISF